MVQNKIIRIHKQKYQIQSGNITDAVAKLWGEKKTRKTTTTKNAVWKADYTQLHKEAEKNSHKKSKHS